MALFRFGYLNDDFPYSRYAGNNVTFDIRAAMLTIRYRAAPSLPSAPHSFSLNSGIGNFDFIRIAAGFKLNLTWADVVFADFPVFELGNVFFYQCHCVPSANNQNVFW